jgi:hypothetical protein
VPQKIISMAAAVHPASTDVGVPPSMGSVSTVHSAPTLVDPLFADLLTGLGCSIPATEKRAISLDQLSLVMKHITRRLTENKEIWQVDHYDKNGVKSQVDLTDPKAVNLYHACAKVIKPATHKQQLSLVEAMSAGDQIPDFFTSHWFVHRAWFAAAHCTCPGGASLWTRC